jgi:hypothetical protein
MHFHMMYKDKEVKKNVKNILLSMCDVKVSLTFTSLNIRRTEHRFYPEIVTDITTRN